MREIKKSLAVLLSLLMIFSSISAGFVISAAEPALVDASIGKYTTYSYYVDGALVDTQTVAEGEKPAAIATPVKDHFRFDGWKETTQSDGSVRCDAEFTQVFFVRFMHRDGRVFMTKQGAKGDIITTSDVAFSVSAEESVTGWYTDPEHTNKVDTVTLDDSDIDLYPTVGRGYWVTYDADGGSYTYPEFYAANAKTKAPAEPTKEGYTFTGWTLDGAPYSFGDTPDGDITLKATWKANGSTHYRVVYLQENANDDGYSYVESKDMTGETGSMTAAAADKSYNGFSAPDTIEQKEIKADGSTVVEVKYKRNIYTIKFYEIEYNWWGDYYYAGDEIADLRITAKYGENVSHQWPGYKGYSAMWSTEPGGSTWQSGISAMPAKNLSFYETDQSGNYTCPYRYYLENLSGDESGESFNGSYYTLDNTIDIKFERGTIVTEEDHFDIEGFTFSGVTADGTNLTTRGLPFYYNRNSYNVIMINGSEKTEKSLQFGAKLTDAYFTPEAPADKTGYEFLGWFDNSIGYGDAIDFDQTTMGAGNMTVYACWKAPTVEVTVSDFDGNEDKTHVEYGGSIDVSALGVPDLPEGEEFLYWAIKEGDSYTQLTSATKIYGPVTIVPMTYSKVPYKVAYDVEEVSDSYTYVKNSSAVVLGYIGDNDFVGWELDGKLYYPNSTVNVSSDLELKAKYAEKQAQVSLNYDANGGDGDSAGRSFKKNTVISVDECSFTRKGYTFDGWNTEADGSGTAFAPGDAVRIIGDAKLWAQWKADEFELEYYVSYGGSETLYKTETVKYGEKLELAELPEENGYTFSDWKVEGGYTTMPEGGAKAICEKTLNEYTAKLEENGGTDVEDIKFTVESAAEALPKTERAGYSFAGWFESPDFSGDAVTEIAAGSIGDITFYAKWDKITDGSSYKVIVRKENAADDGYAETTETIRATVEDVINFTGAEYAEEGFVFDAENSVVSGIVAGDGSLTLTLSYNRTRNTVRYFVDGVCTDIHEGVKFGAATPAYSKETPGKVGYTFAGWGDVQPKVAGDADYNAEWTVNTWAVTFYEEDGETVIRTLTVDYGEKIDASGIVPAEKTGYTFSGWDIPETMPDNDLSFTASYTPNSDTQYKVETYKMNVSGSDYELVSADMKNGTTDTEAQTDAPGQEGFSLNEEKSILQGNIAGDGSLVLKIYYDRNQYTLTVDNANGDEIIQTTLYYGAWVSVSQPDRVGYIFAGWNNTVPEKMPADDVTLTALWTARTDLTGKVTYTDTNGKQLLADKELTALTMDTELTEYAPEIAGYDVDESAKTITVKAENNVIGFVYTPRNDIEATVSFVDGSGKKLISDVTVKDLTMDTEFSFEPAEIAGYITPAKQTITLKADGNAIVYVYDARTDLTGKVTYTDTNGKQLLADKELTALTMDTELTEYAPEIAGYDVDESAKTITVKAENNVIGFVYTPRNDTKYTVRHILQDLSGEYTIIPKTDEMTGTTDEMTKAVPESYEGFSNQAVTNEPIKGDGTTVVDIRYDRLSYTVAFYDYKGEPIEAVKTLYFGAEITAPAVVPDYLTEESGFTFRHVFTSWNITVPTTIPVGGVAAFAKYTMPCAYAGFDDAVKALHDLVDGEELNDAAEKKLDELLKLIDGINGGKSTRDASEQKTVDDAEKKIRDFILEISEDGNIDPDILVHYDVSFFVKKNFGETEQLGKTQSVASGRAAEVPTDIEDYYDAANHYSFSGKWSLTSSDGSLESVRSNINAYAVYNAQAHTLIDTVIVRPELMSGKWSSGKVRSACKCGYFFDTDYERADYTKYDKAVSDLRSLLEKDIRSDIRLEIESVLAANEIENNLIGTNPSPRNAALIGEQWIVDEAAKSLALTLEKYLDDDGNIKNDIFNKYTVSFVNYDGFILEQIENVVSGNTVRYTGKTPERPFDESFHYVFAGWDKDASSTQITADTVFTAQFESVSHSKTKLVCEPTCTEEGYTVYKCLDCAYLSEKSDFVPAKGHSFNRDPATATLVEAGIAGLDETFTYDRYKCDDCDAMAIVLHIVTVDPESDNSPVVGADVTIINGSGQKVDGGKTDENGRFDSKYLPAEDSYRIRIEDPETGRVAKGDIAVDGDAYIIDGSFSGRLGDCGECICHTNTKFGIIIRFICTILSGVFGTEIKCCKDMKWCFKI